MSSWIIPHELHLHLHVHNGPYGLGEAFVDEMSEEDPSESEFSSVVDGGRES